MTELCHSLKWKPWILFDAIRRIGYNGRVKGKEFERVIRRFMVLALVGLTAMWGGVSPGLLSVGAESAQPYRALKTVFDYPVDRVNPSAQTNPSGGKMPGFRAANQLVVYTAGFGDRTGTQVYGAEAVVEAGKVVRLGDGNQAIPKEGWVISGHGRAAIWIKRFLKPGAQVSLDPSQKHLNVRWTRRSAMEETEGLARLIEVRLKDPALNPQARSEAPEEAALWTEQYQSAQACRNRLLPTGADHEALPLDAPFMDEVKQCQEAWSTVFYGTVVSEDKGFRGVWIRPGETQPEPVEEMVARLKRLGVKEVFLEAYYQGKTIYPSQVMKDYGLSPQHPMFAHADPLKLWLDAAHQEGLKVHVWFQTYFAGNQLENVERFGPILSRYPQWANVQLQAVDEKTPVPSGIEEGHYFLDPAHPEVNRFLMKLVSELVTQYPVDGVNLDYIRYPASLPVGAGDYLSSNWGYTPVARARFKEYLEFLWRQAAEKARQEKEALAAKSPANPQGKKGLVVKQAPTKQLLKPPMKPPTRLVQGKPVDPFDPRYLTVQDKDWPLWVQWRKDQVSRFVQEAAVEIHQIRPEALVSAVVFPRPDPQYAWKLQDWPTWVQQGHIQALTPIGLSPTPDGMYHHAEQLKQIVHGKVPVYVGIFGAYNRLTPLETIQQIDAVQRVGLSGVILFDGGRVGPEYQHALWAGPFRSLRQTPPLDEATSHGNNVPAANASPH